MARRGHFDSKSDEDLVHICNSGSASDATAAFETIYFRHKDFVVRVALRFVPDNDSALDVVQDTFDYLLRKFPPPGPGLALNAKLTSLLYPVAKNNAITLLRKAQRFPATDNIDPDSLPGRSDAPAADIDPLLEELSDERREVLQLRFIDDLTLQEIAGALQIPLGTVKSRLHLAIKQLRESNAAKKLLDP